MKKALALVVISTVIAAYGQELSKSAIDAADQAVLYRAFQMSGQSHGGLEMLDKHQLGEIKNLIIESAGKVDNGERDKIVCIAAKWYIGVAPVAEIETLEKLRPLAVSMASENELPGGARVILIAYLDETKKASDNGGAPNAPSPR